MTNYTLNQTSNTVGSMVLLINMGVSLLGPGTSDFVGSSQFDPSLILPSHVRIEKTPGTQSQYQNIFTENSLQSTLGRHEISTLEFENTVASFYAQFLAKQEPLGKEFEQVLYDNLWDLLVRT